MIPSAVLTFPPQFFWGTCDRSYDYESLETIPTEWERAIRITGESGLNCLLLSPNWSLLHPEPTRRNEDYVDICREQLYKAKSLGITPILLLFPEQSAELFVNEQADKQVFTESIERLAEDFGSIISHWVTFYEPEKLITALPFNRQFGIARALAETHKATADAIHRVREEAQIGLAVSARLSQTALQFNDTFIKYFKNDSVTVGISRKNLPGLNDTLDFILPHCFITDNQRFSENHDWLFKALKELTKYQKPLLPVLQSRSDGDFRTNLLAEEIIQIREARNEGVPIIGILTPDFLTTPNRDPLQLLFSQTAGNNLLDLALVRQLSPKVVLRYFDY